MIITNKNNIFMRTLSGAWSLFSNILYLRCRSGGISHADFSFKKLRKEKMFSTRQKTTPNLAGGFTILFSVLVGSLVLAIGLAILNVTIKQITLSGAGRESHKSFYAADSAMECVLYYDRISRPITCTPGVGIFQSPGPSGQSLCQPNPSPFNCGPESSMLVTSRAVGNDFINTVTVSDSNTFCATVEVTKYDPGDPLTTTIIARGLNKCSGGNVYERAIKVDY